MGLLCRADSQAFPRHEHLTRKSDFERAYAEGVKWVNEAFVCYAVRRAGQGRKIGCAVSRKVGSAVVRNRVKRYIREIYRTHRTELVDDLHLVVVARVASAGMTYRTCADAMRRIFQKGDMLRG